MSTCPPSSGFSIFSRTFIGFAIVMAGILLFAFNAGMLPEAYKQIVFSWPMLILMLGLAKVLQGKHIFPGLLLSGIGLHLLSPRLGFIIPDLGNITLPLFLVILGAAVMLRRKSDDTWFPRQRLRTEPRSCDTDGRIHENSVFGGSKRTLRDMVFRGGEINCVFGGSELDLTGADLADGSTYLDVHCVFGGATIIVPEEWVVRIQVNSIFGDFMDQGRVPADRKEVSKILVVTGSCVFGGGEIRYQART